MSKLGGMTNLVMDEDGNIRPAREPVAPGYTSSFLPVRKDTQGFHPAMPGILSGAVSSAQDPGRALRGEYVDPERGVEFGMNLLGGSSVAAGKKVFQRPVPGELRMLVGETAKLPPNVMDDLARAKKAKADGHRSADIVRSTGWDDRSGQWEYDVVEKSGDFPSSIKSAAQHEHPYLNQVYPESKFPQVVDERASNNSLETLYSRNPATGEWDSHPSKLTFRSPKPRRQTWAHEGQHAADSITGQTARHSQEKSGHTYDPKTATHTFTDIPAYLRRRTEVRARVNEMRLNWGDDLRRYIPARDMHEWEVERIKRLQARNLAPNDQRYLDDARPGYEEYRDFLGQYGIPEESTTKLADLGALHGAVKPEPPPDLRTEAQKTLKRLGIAHTEGWASTSGKRYVRDLRKWGTQEKISPEDLTGDAAEAWKVLNQ